MSESTVGAARSCAWCDEPAITKTETGMRACWHHAALDWVRAKQLADSKARMDAVAAEITNNRASADAIRVGSMKPADVTAAPSEVVAEVLRDPETFLTAAAEAAPGWSTRYGGPEGVAQLTSTLHEHLAELTQRNAALRGATVLYLHRHAKVQLLTIARLLGVTKGAVNHVIRRAELESAREWGFTKLENPRGWKH